MYTAPHQFEPLLPLDARMEPLLAKAHDLSRLATTCKKALEILRNNNFSNAKSIAGGSKALDEIIEKGTVSVF